MESKCSSCNEIVELEQSLDKQANDLVSKVNSLCANVRAENKKKWENFEYWVNLPVIGGLVYELFRAPKGLKAEPDYGHSEWYKSEAMKIIEQVQLIEKMKSEHMEHWGDERVTAEFGWDYAGYYEGNHPANPMLRRDAYKPYIIEGSEEDRLTVFLPREYDFVSAAGSNKMQEGAFVLDKNSKKIVPLKNCDWISAVFADNFIGKISKIFARTNCTYLVR